MSQSKNLINLPDEVLSKIFNFLSSKELLTITLVCKEFNKIISNDKKLQEKLKITKISNFSGLQWISGTRNNQTTFVAVDFHSSNLLSENFEGFRENVQTLLILERNRKTFANEIILNILRNFSNLKTIKFDCYVNAVRNVDKEVLPKLELDYLKTNFLTTLDFFTKSKVKKLKIGLSELLEPNELFTYEYNRRRGDVKIFYKFLKSQQHLEHLTYDNENYEHVNDDGSITLIDTLFEDKTLNRVDFRLKSLIVNWNAVGNYQNFFKFLLIHKKSLKFLRLKGFGYYLKSDVDLNSKIRLLNHFKSLETLEVSCIGPLLEFYTLPNLKSLTLTYHSNEHNDHTRPSLIFETKFKKLEKLHLRLFKVNFRFTKFVFPKLKILHLEFYNGDPLNTTTSENSGIASLCESDLNHRPELIPKSLVTPTELKYLEVLSLCDCSSVILVIPSTLKKLELTRVKFAQTPTFQMNSKLDDIALLRVDVEWLATHLKNCENIKQLKLNFLDISYEFYKVFYKNKNKITKLDFKEVKLVEKTWWKKLLFICLKTC